MVNKVVLVGYLGADPEVRSTQAGQSVANFSLATSEKWKDKDGNVQEKTEWHRIQCWGNLADIVGKHCVKGKLVYVEGKIQTRKWQDKEGQDRYTTEIVAHEVKFLGGGGSKDGEERQTPARQERPMNQARPAGGGRVQPAGSDDDIPF